MLTPDFLRKPGALERRGRGAARRLQPQSGDRAALYLTVRPGARYFHSLRLLAAGQGARPDDFTKSGIMVGLGESRNEVLQVMDDMRSAEVDFITIGQYLQPTRKHHAIDRFVTPEEFEAFRRSPVPRASPMSRPRR